MHNETQVISREHLNSFSPKPVRAHAAKLLHTCSQGIQANPRMPGSCHFKLLFFFLLDPPRLSLTSSTGAGKGGLGATSSCSTGLSIPAAAVVPAPLGARGGVPSMRPLFRVSGGPIPGARQPCREVSGSTRRVNWFLCTLSYICLDKMV